jgi:hypothetical protein
MGCMEGASKEVARKVVSVRSVHSCCMHLQLVAVFRAKKAMEPPIFN